MFFVHNTYLNRYCKTAEDYNEQKERVLAVCGKKENYGYIQIKIINDFTLFYEIGGTFYEKGFYY